jgi:2-C-methyl-D-erythritol 4-phosphate cytidylyltransferase
VHDPTLPTVIRTFRPAGEPGAVAVARHPVDREPATGVRCDTAALRALLDAIDTAAVRLALIPEAMSDEATAAWVAVAAAHQAGDVVVTAGPVTDAVKAVDAEGHIVATVDREDLRWARTPALFPVDRLRDALGPVTADTVDPVSLLGAPGSSIRWVVG